jgi:hypothetical protein
MRPRRPLSQEQPSDDASRGPEAVEPSRQPAKPAVRRHLTREARALLREAEAGGVPMFVSQNLRRIAEENGVELSDEMTPNEVLEALRARAASA